MCNNYFAIMFMLGVVFVTTASQAQENFAKMYVRGGIGISFPIKKFKETDDSEYLPKRPKNSVLYNIGLGYVINDRWRSDLNFTYRMLHYKAEEEDLGHVDGIAQKANIYSLFLNGYYDLNFNKIIKPYLTIGIGYGYNKSGTAVPTTDGEVDDGDELPGKKTSNFIWNVGIGTRFILSNKFNLDISYRYVDLGRITTKDSITKIVKGKVQKIRSHDIMSGAIIHL